MPTLMRIRVEIGRDFADRPIYKWACGRNPKEVHRAIALIHLQYGLLQIDEMPLPVPIPEKKQKGIKFGEYAEMWLTTYKEPKLKPTTLRGYRSMLDAHLLPAFDKCEFRGITTDDVQKLLNSKDNLAKKTLQYILTLFKEICADAIEDGHLEKNPTESRKLAIPSDKKSERKALPPEHMVDILEHIGCLDDTERAMMALFLLTGMRRGEVLGLRWEDIDIKGGLIRIVRNITFPYNQPVIGTPKSEKGKRVIPLSKQLWGLLQPVQAEGYIVGGEKPLTKMVYQRMWSRIEKKINLHGASPHIFRHSYLTLASNAGIDPKTIQALAGHADIGTTMNIYVHSQTDHLKDAGEKLLNHMFHKNEE